MNKARRESLQKVAEALQNAKDWLGGLRDEEQGYHDSMPEAFQYGGKGLLAEEAVSQMEEAVGSLEDALGALSDIK